MKDTTLQPFEKIDQRPESEVRADLTRCCGSSRWVAEMMARRPFGSNERLMEAAAEIWRGLSIEDWREAFSHHPRIGDRSSLEKKFATTKQWAADEQKGTAAAAPEVLDGLLVDNETYEKKFGYIFIVCATGKTALEMLNLLRQRLPNAPDDEIRIAAAEQQKITKLRLEKL